MTYEIETINHEQAMEIIENRFPFGLFIAKENDKYIAIDNRIGEAWTEEFFSLYVANCWLVDDMTYGEAYQADDSVKRIAEAIKMHPWYENETMEKCREMAEHAIMNLRKGAN